MSMRNSSSCGDGTGCWRTRSSSPPRPRVTLVTGSSGGIRSSVVAALRARLGPAGICVNAVNPGPVNTPLRSQLADRSGSAQATRDPRAAQLPMQRFAEPEEVASASAFLTDPVNRYVIGVSLDVAGGAHLGIGS